MGLGASCNALQELHRCAELCNLLSIIVANGPELKKPAPANTDWVSLQACFFTTHHEPMMERCMNRSETAGNSSSAVVPSAGSPCHIAMWDLAKPILQMQARAVACSKSSPLRGGMQPLLKSIMELLNVFLCKSLGSCASGALHSLLGSDSPKLFARCDTFILNSGAIQEQLWNTKV